MVCDVKLKEMEKHAGKFVVTSGLRRRTFCSIVVSGAVIKLLQLEVTSELRGALARGRSGAKC